LSEVARTDGGGWTELLRVGSDAGPVFAATDGNQLDNSRWGYNGTASATFIDELGTTGRFNDVQQGLMCMYTDGSELSVYRQEMVAGYRLMGR